MKLTRRTFTHSAAVATVATAASYNRILGANDRVRLGFIALGNRGDQVLDGFLAHKDQDVVAVCDIWQPYMDFASKKIGSAPKQFKDYRQLLDVKDIDAVAINTPDHWHALQTVHACQAGKDVYVEKPLSLCVAEGRQMVEAAAKHKRVTQVGLMRRSEPIIREACEIVRKGGIGQVTAARCFHIQNEFPKGIGSPNDPPPEGFDWEAWLGPAPKMPYNKNRTFYRFRWFYDYSGGQLTNFGVHYLDNIHWALGQDQPLAVVAMGGKYAVKDNREVPDTLEVLWTYPGNTLVSFTQVNTNAAPANANKAEIVFCGTKGTLYLSSRGYEIVPDLLPVNEFPARTPLTRDEDRKYRQGAKAEIEAAKKEGGKDGTMLHARNFLDCVKSREKCHCDIETGHRSTSAPLIGNIAHKLKAYLEWDGKAERFTNNDAANKHLKVDYRPPYKLPG